MVSHLRQKWGEIDTIVYNDIFFISCLDSSRVTRDGELPEGPGEWIMLNERIDPMTCQLHPYYGMFVFGRDPGGGPSGVVKG